MIIRIVKMGFHTENIEAFKDIFENSKHLIRGFNGCLHLELLEKVDEPNIMFTYSHWESEEHLNEYRKSELFEKTWAATKILFNTKPEAWSVFQKYKSN
jgi:heme oxygenase (mycobilin-producing)